MVAWSSDNFDKKIMSKFDEFFHEAFGESCPKPFDDDEGVIVGCVMA